MHGRSGLGLRVVISVLIASAVSLGALAFGLRRRVLVPVLPEPARAPAPVEDPPAEPVESAEARLRRLLDEALKEQVRREKDHHLPYRPDERVLAVQQRLSRALGQTAMTSEFKQMVQREIALGGMERHK